MRTEYGAKRAEAMYGCLKESGLSVDEIKRLICRISDNTLTHEDKEILEELGRRVNKKAPQTVN